LVIVFGGDFRQVLPVVTKGSMQECFEACLIKKFYSKEIKFLLLTQNHRTDADQENLRNFLADVGRGRNFHEKIDDFTSKIKLPDGIQCVGNLDELIEAVFPTDKLTDSSSWSRSAIVAPLNTSVTQINNKILMKMPGDIHCYDAINEADDDTVDPNDREAVEATEENMARVEETDLPQQQLLLKIGVKVIMIKNIDVRYRCCNGTPAIVRECRPDVITVERIEPDGRPGELVDIVRRQVVRKAKIESGSALSFTRTQFPLKLAFAMTIHKAQGQTLSRVGIYLNSPVFACGQLYVSLSRTHREEDIIVFNPKDSRIIQNIVHPGVSKFLDDLEKVHEPILRGNPEMNQGPAPPGNRETDQAREAAQAQPAQAQPGNLERAQGHNDRFELE
jgi:ATP-dependent DNA helicase PIF1